MSVIGLFLYGCGNNTTEPDLRTECQKKNVGYITFTNNSSDPFDVFVNNTLYKQMPGNTYTAKLAYPAGKSYTIKAQQAAGYIFTPTIRTTTFTLNQCDEKSFSFTD